MITLDSFRLENSFLYKKAVVDFSPGVHVVRGLNHDANGTPNFVGKSSLFFALYELIQGELPYAARKGSRTEYTGVGTLQANSEAVNWKVRCDFSHGSKLAIWKDDAEQSFRKKNDARALLRELLPWNLDTYRTLIHLNSFDGNVILHGNDTARHVLFEHLFNLNVYDLLLKECKSHLDELKDAAARSQELEELLPARPDSKRIAQLEQLTADGKRKVRDLQRRLDAQNADLQRQSAAQALLRQLPTVYSKTPLTELETRLQNCTLDHKHHTRLLHKSSRNDQRKKSSERRERLRQQLREHPPVKDARKLERTRSQLESEQERLESLVSRLGRLRERIQPLWREFERLSNKHRKAFRVRWKPDSDFQTRDLQMERSRLDERLRVLEHTDEGCPVCAGKLSAVKRKELRNAIRVDRETCDQRLRQVRKLETLAESLVPHLEILGHLDRVHQFRRDLKRLTPKLRKLDAQLQAHRKHENLQSQIQALRGKPWKHALPPAAKVERRLEMLRKHRTELQQAVDIRRQLDEMGKLPSTDVQRVQRKTQQALAARTERLYAQRSELQTLLKQREDWTRIHERKARLQSRLRHQPVLAWLAERFGPRGMRVHDVQALITDYVQNLNNLSSHVFPAGYQFLVEPGNRTLSIKVERGTGTTDVRRLSGFESRAFALLNVMTLLRMLPSRFRTNVLILDEIEAGVGAQSRLQLCSTFIPLLQSVIPCIYMLTPLESKEMYIPGAIEHLVERKNNASTFKTLGAA